MGFDDALKNLLQMGSKMTEQDIRKFAKEHAGNVDLEQMMDEGWDISGFENESIPKVVPASLPLGSLFLNAIKLSQEERELDTKGILHPETLELGRKDIKNHYTIGPNMSDKMLDNKELTRRVLKLEAMLESLISNGHFFAAPFSTMKDAGKGVE